MSTYAAYAVAVSRLKNFYQQTLYESPLSPFYDPDYSIYDEKDNTFELEARITARYLTGPEKAISSVREIPKYLEENAKVRSLFAEITADDLWDELDTGAIDILESTEAEIDDLDYDDTPYIETRHDFGSFGEFLEFKRKERSLTATAVSDAIGVSRRYYSDVEKGARLPFDKKNLTLLAEVLNFNELEREEMYDLAAKERNETPLDVACYLESHEYMYEFIRRIKKADISRRRLFSFLHRVERKPEKIR